MRTVELAGHLLDIARQHDDLEVFWFTCREEPDLRALTKDDLWVVVNDEDPTEKTLQIYPS